MKEEIPVVRNESMTEIKSETPLKDATTAATKKDVNLDPHSFIGSAYMTFMYTHKSPWSE